MEKLRILEMRSIQLAAGKLNYFYKHRAGDKGDFQFQCLRRTFTAQLVVIVCMEAFKSCVLF
jgi:hypothetical protein